MYRDVLELEGPKKQLGFLFRDYTADAYWFEICELLRKLTLCGVTGYIAPGTSTQIVFCLVFSVLCTSRRACAAPPSRETPLGRREDAVTTPVRTP